MKSKQKRKAIVFVSVAVLAVGAVGFGVWTIIDQRNEISSLQASLNEKNEELDNLKRDIVSNPNDAVSRLQQEQNASILDEIRQVYAIPEGETPTIATVEDVTKLVDQPFFEGAENGDILVVLNDSSQAILYRPSTKQLVKVGPISAGAQTEATGGSTGESEQPSEEE